MRWTLSFTAVSGRPTRMVLGSPAATSTSASTGAASMPSKANVLSLASMRRLREHGNIPACCIADLGYLQRDAFLRSPFLQDRGLARRLRLALPQQIADLRQQLLVLRHRRDRRGLGFLRVHHPAEELDNEDKQGERHDQEV